MACSVLASTIQACTVEASTVLACTVLASTELACTEPASIVLASIVGTPELHATTTFSYSYDNKNK